MLEKLVVRLRLGENGPIIAWCLGAVALWRFCLELLNQTLVPYLTPPAYVPTRDLPNPHVFAGLLRWMNWDGGWYATIVQHGYIIQHNLQGSETIAFYPFFPYLIKVISDITHISYRAIGFGVNAVAVVAVMFFTYKLTMLLMKGSEKTKHTAGKVAVAALLISPASFFFAAYYAEPVLVLSFTAAIYYAIKEKYVVAVVFAVLASATKIDGAVLGLVIMLLYAQKYYRPSISYWENLKRHGLQLIGLGIASISGMLLYLLYLWHRFGSPLVSLENQKYWGRESGNFLVNLWQDYYSHAGSIYYFGNKINYVYNLYLMALPFIILIALWFALKHRRRSWLSLFTVVLLLLPILSGTLISLNRVVLVTTPLLSCVVVAIMESKRSYVRTASYAIGCVSIALLTMCTVAFLGSYFVG